MKKHTFYLMICFVLSSFLLSSCLKDDDNNYIDIPAGGLTMINGFSDAQGIVYYADQRAVQNPYFPLMYKGYDWVGLFTGNRNIIVKGTQDPKTLVDTTFAVKDSVYYSSFTFGNKDKAKHFITEDKKMSITSGTEKQTGLRFFNLADMPGKVSLQIGDAALNDKFKDRATETQTTATANQIFLPQASGTFKLSVKDESGTVLVSRDGIKLDPDNYYSIILVGKKDNTNTPLYIGVVKQAVN
ncbi:DUF4397 domain-containing protein [Sphingobacterium spiritivorum]|uniref:DUF4397 domain-containing protein n=1 Tax=Sphingobacterium spiritivorum ATCC 33861 TaxID=525373 RepID=D7VS74_SPHSI|nr:DUF4397 domain-containing protein [Sphingobacterium spiritivorum]EFK56625.1 hypothetical protein HMPREF0766_13828 [Sphingobacterium spiritivorum ATCC 33861]QQT35328.1 DUF4397 domain-containing protein [Sphingobacterium spiritivorum]WQD32009.1 DUF4397 domain-containing protein [Sphingobacterium spiritivorum]SUJ04958.1 Uncharacterised protein [Sphingobacterium spiritivorum]